LGGRIKIINRNHLVLAYPSLRNGKDSVGKYGTVIVKFPDDLTGPDDIKCKFNFGPIVRVGIVYGSLTIDRWANGHPAATYLPTLSCGVKVVHRDSPVSTCPV
jgi:hypothetical protein